MRDGLGVLLVAAGLTWAVLTLDNLGLVTAFGGVTLLAHGVLRQPFARQPHEKEPPISNALLLRLGFGVMATP